jgi:hypothetical protein
MGDVAKFSKELKERLPGIGPLELRGGCSILGSWLSFRPDDMAELAL